MIDEIHDPEKGGAHGPRHGATVTPEASPVLGEGQPIVVVAFNAGDPTPDAAADGFHRRVVGRYSLPPGVTEDQFIAAMDALLARSGETVDVVPAKTVYLKASIPSTDTSDDFVDLINERLAAAGHPSSVALCDSSDILVTLDIEDPDRAYTSGHPVRLDRALGDLVRSRPLVAAQLSSGDGRSLDEVVDVYSWNASQHRQFCARDFSKTLDELQIGNGHTIAVWWKGIPEAAIPLAELSTIAAKLSRVSSISATNFFTELNIDLSRHPGHGTSEELWFALVKDVHDGASAMAGWRRQGICTLLNLILKRFPVNKEIENLAKRYRTQIQTVVAPGIPAA